MGSEAERGLETEAEKKSRRFRRLKGDNREASNRVDRSHSTSRSWTLTVMIEKA
jgi:hypothetical protein